MSESEFKNDKANAYYLDIDIDQMIGEMLLGPLPSSL